MFYIYSCYCIDLIYIISKLTNVLFSFYILDHQWPWFVPRNMDKPISGYYNQPWNNAPF